VEVADAQQLRVKADPGALEGRTVAVDARDRAEHVIGPADHADPPVAECQQVLCGSEASGPVGRADRGHIWLRLIGGIDDDEVDAAASQLAFLRWPEVREHEDHADRAAAQDAIDPGVTGAVAVTALGQDQADAGFARDALDAADDLDRPLALELVEDELDHAGGAVA
jgi:hypothetical protein